MSIAQQPRGQYVFTCDKCGDDLVTDHTLLAMAEEEARNDGWRTYPSHGKWFQAVGDDTHECRACSCRGSGRYGRLGTDKRAATMRKNAARARTNFGFINRKGSPDLPRDIAHDQEDAIEEK